MLIPIDMNDRLGALTAIEVPYPESFSEKAWKVIRYMDGCMYLFFYKGKYVATDASISQSMATVQGKLRLGLPAGPETASKNLNTGWRISPISMTKKAIFPAGERSKYELLFYA